MDQRGLDNFREDDLDAFHQKVHLSMAVTAVFPGKLAIMRCLCRDSLVMVYVAHGQVLDATMQSWN